MRKSSKSFAIEIMNDIYGTVSSFFHDSTLLLYGSVSLKVLFKVEFKGIAFQVFKLF